MFCEWLEIVWKTTARPPGKAKFIVATGVLIKWLGSFYFLLLIFANSVIL